ncbi:hypothetical protein ABT297_39120 [Dactylosporangium sp. NPDC000555]|uniref:hypothetical protein n=1 Tax=Dactylosporangium sp. NPDC000555 TaxID=3154260 RepID=UPI00331D7402
MIVAVIVAPLAWVLLALGQARSTGAFPDTGHGTDLQPGDFVRPVLLLAAAGLVLGILGTLRLSPLGAMVIGIGYTLSYAMLLVAPSRTMNLFSDDLWVAGRHIDLAAPLRSGTTMVLGVLLLVGAFSMQRWRRWPRPDDAAGETTRASDRPLGTEGLGLSLPYRDAEPARPATYATPTEPYDTAAWAEPADELPKRIRTSAGRTTDGW